MKEHYIGVDLHKAFFQACAVTPDGARAWEDRFPRTAEGMAAFVTRCTTQTAIAVEASTPTWHFADAITAHVGDLRIVDSVKTRLKAGYAAKTDRLDARRLADALRRDSVVGIYYPPVEIRELRELCRGRHTLVQLRTRLLQRLRAILLRHGIVEARRLVRQDAVLDALELPPRALASVASLRRVLAVVRTEIQIVEREVLTLATTDPIAVALQRLPGIGPRLALMIRAEIGDIRRFPTPGHVASYAGLGSRVDASCWSLSLRPHHATRIPVVTVGSRRSGNTRTPPTGSGRAVGATARDSERRAESACGGRAQLVCGNLYGVDRVCVTSSPGRWVGL